MRRLLLVAPPLLLAACEATAVGPASPPEATATDLSCEAMPDPHCAHPIDRLLIPELRRAGVTPTEAGSDELCRRMAIDLAGRIPTPDERAACRTLAPDAMADEFMSSPDYLRTQRRAWGERIPYDVSLTWYAHVAELDQLVAAHFDPAGALPYDELAARIAVHPGFFARHMGDDWATAIFQIFLGRTARPDELAGMRPLSMIWSSRSFCDGATMYNIQQLEDSFSPNFCDDVQDEVGVDFCLCMPGDGFVGCRSDVLGKSVDFGTEGCLDPEADDDQANLLRASDAGLGLRATCPDGTRGCRDQAVDDLDNVTGPISPLPQMSAASMQHLHTLGEALAARDDFWEAAVDRELRHFLGWWQNGFRHPDYDLPAVRRALAAELRKTRSLRALEKTIVTSLLYTAPSAAPATGEKEPPVWAMGPTKMLVAESWLDSAAAAVGEVLGVCDFRFVSAEDDTEVLVDPTLLETVTPTLPEFADEEEDKYRVESQRLGGCSADQPRPGVSSLGIAYEERAMAHYLCAVGRAVVPQGFDPGDLSSAGGKLFEQILSRPPSGEELAALTAEMQACLSAGGEGCETPEQALRWLCARLLDSAEFALY